MATPTILQWNCRSYQQNHLTLLQRIRQIQPLFILLQETRTTPNVRGYTTYTSPCITCKPHRNSNGSTLTPGYAAVLVRADLASRQVIVPGLTSTQHEVVVAHARLPSGKTIVVASAYYRPITGSLRNVSFNWINQLKSQFPCTNMVIGGDFNAKSHTWGYTNTDKRGAALEETAELCNLHLVNDLACATRVGLHPSQRDTIPDLTWTTAGLIRNWSTYSTTWGSDHYPISITLRGKRLRMTKTITRTDWCAFRQALNAHEDHDLSAFIAGVQQASHTASEQVTCYEDTPAIDGHLSNLWKRVEQLTHRYRYNGHRHRDLMRIRHQYKLINSYQKELMNDHWNDLCSSLSKERGLSKLWRIYRGLAGKSKKPQPLFSTLALTDDPATVEHQLITTFFPTASLTQPPSLPVIQVPHSREDLDSPFTLAELRAAIMQGKLRSAPGHDGITWQQIRNMDDFTLTRLLAHVNKLWEMSEVPDYLKLTLVHPIPKPNKDPNVITNLRPISLTPTLCKLIERLIHARLQYYLEYAQPWFHPSQTGFRPHLGTHDCLWLLRRVINRSARSCGLPDYVLAVDIRKAFDRVSQTAILEELAQAYPSQKTQDWVRHFLQSRPIKLNGSHPGWSPRTYFLDRGVPQGSILGPVLFNLAMTRMARQLERDTSARFAIYADDITIWTEGNDFENTDSMITELQAAVASLENHLPQLGLEMAPEKTELLLVHGTKSSPDTEPTALHIANNTIRATCGHIRLLGIPLGSHNSPKIWLTKLKKQWKPMLHLIKRLSNKYGGAQQSSCVALARAVAIGALAYGAPVYDFSKTNLKFLHTLHRATLRTITGLPRHTRITALEQAAPLPPIDLIMKETRMQADFKRTITPQGLALSDWDNQRPIQVHNLLSPMAPWTLPDVAPNAPSKPVPRGHSMLRKQRLEKLKRSRLPGEIDIYTDASVRDHIVGLAWHCSENPDLSGTASLNLVHITPLEAELHAVIGTLNHISFDVSQMPPSHIRILTDSFGVVQELRRQSSLNPLTQQILTHVALLRRNGVSVRIDWVPGHETACTGNQAAHSAAQESSITPPLVPCTPTPSPLPPSLQLLRHKRDKRNRYIAATPQGYLTGIPPLPRAGEVFLNKLLANAAYTPHIIRKWLSPNLPLKCTFCNTLTYADLNHLLRDCSFFSQHRSDIITSFHAPTSTPEDYHTMEKPLLHKIGLFAIKSGLARAV